MTEHPDIWRSFCTALGAEYREHREIQGSSGLSHAVQAIAVDDEGKRLILVSAEPNPRVAALMRVDVQVTMPDVRVLVARPLAVDLAHTVRTVFGNGKGEIDLAAMVTAMTMLGMGDAGIDQLKHAYGPAFAPLLAAVGRSNLPILSHIMNTIQQAASIDWIKLREPLSSSKADGIVPLAQFFFDQFQHLDNLAEDRKQGICPVPTYELNDADWELFRQSTRIDDVRERLKALGVYQYFFPPKDTLALGLIDRGLNTPEMVERGLSLAERGGHPLSANAIIPDVADIPDLMDELRAKGLTLEADFESETLTPDGHKVRSTLKVRPSEGLLEKISKVFSVKFDVSLKDLLK